jgi:hypothetical protein
MLRAGVDLHSSKSRTDTDNIGLPKIDQSASIDSLLWTLSRTHPKAEIDENGDSHIASGKTDVAGASQMRPHQ